MSFLFSKSIIKFQEYTEKYWLYFFLTSPQPNDRQAFVKFGKTERRLIERLTDYSSLDLANIYAIQIPENELSSLEGAMKKIFKVCKISTNVDIWPKSGIEYIKGNLDLMLRIFFHFSTMPFDKVTMYNSNSIVVKESSILEWIDNLYPISHYTIQMLTPKKIHKMTPEVQDIHEVKDNTLNDEDTEDEYNSDVEEENSDNEIDEHQCPRCGRACKDRRGYTIHFRKCKGIENLECKYCGKNFSSGYCLSTHEPRCSKYKENKSNKENELIEENQKLKKQIEELQHKYKNSKESDYKESESKIQSIDKYHLEIKSKDKEISELRLNNKLLSATIESKKSIISYLEYILREEKKEKRDLINLIAKINGIDMIKHD